MGRGAYDTTGLPSAIPPPPESTINVFDEPRPFRDFPGNVSRPSEDLMKTQDPGPVVDIPTSTYDPLLSKERNLRREFGGAIEQTLA